MMRRWDRIVLMVGLVALAPVLAGCENFDLDKLDVFHLNEKKKLPGERHPVFPAGVPGVTQGVPPEYLKGNQPPPETADVLPPQQKAVRKLRSRRALPPVSGRTGPPPSNRCKPRRKCRPSRSQNRNQRPKPRQSRKPKPKSEPATAANQPPAQQQQPRQQQPGLAPWPGTQNTGTAPWPAAPPPGTFSR